MALNSNIEWTESTWNPTTGCTKISEGCKNCYAERMAKRLKAMRSPNYKNGFNLTLHEHLLEMPLKIKKPHTFFVNSMSDLFHKDIPVSFIERVFNVMENAHWHKFQILTKRSERLLDINKNINWPVNVWMGVTVENKKYQDRIDALRNTGAIIKFISFEPLLGPCNNLEFTNIDWVIVGGESGPKCRPIKEEWVKDIRNQCYKFNVPFFFKQWGGINKKANGRMLDGRIYDALPSMVYSG